MRRMIGVVVGFTCTSISARYALAQRLLVAYSPNRRGARCRAHGQRRVSGSGKRSWSIRLPSPSFRRNGYAGAQFFVEPYAAQGRRGLRTRAGRFARPPLSGK